MPKLRFTKWSAYRSLFGAVSSALLTIFALPPFNLFPLAWGALIPLLVVVQGQSAKRALGLGWFAGTLFFALLLYWIVPLYPYTDLPPFPAIMVTLGATLLLAAYLGLYWGLFSLLVARGDPRPWHWPLRVALVWSGLEYIRAWMFSGMPWGSMGYTQWNALPAIQIADLVGVYGVSFVIVLANAALYQLGRYRTAWRRYAVLPAIVLAFTFSYGAWRLARFSPPPPKMEVALIPGNLPQMEKWKGRHLNRMLERYLEPTRQLADQPPDLIVWPETALPINLLAPGRAYYYQKLYNALRWVDRPLLFGTPYGIEGRYYNAVFLLDAYGQPRGSYFKMHLVPFGESVPLKRWLPRPLLERLVGTAEFDPGTEVRLFEIPGQEGIKLGTVICFESVFPRDFRKFVKAGANVMGILTNDAWFEGTTAPAQHFAMAPLRAVENRVPIFRCANGGISGIIDASGRVRPQKIRAPEQGVLRARLSYRQTTTFYTRFGNWLPFLGGLYVLILGLGEWRRHHTRRMA